jgi:hypothetical protein
LTCRVWCSSGQGAGFKDEDAVWVPRLLVPAFEHCVAALPDQSIIFSCLTLLLGTACIDLSFYFFFCFSPIIPNYLTSSRRSTTDYHLSTTHRNESSPALLRSDYAAVTMSAHSLSKNPGLPNTESVFHRLYLPVPLPASTGTASSSSTWMP